MDGKLPEISVLDSKCLMAEKFGILFTPAGILAPKNGYAVHALNLGLNPLSLPTLCSPAQAVATNHVIESRQPSPKGLPAGYLIVLTR